MRDVHTLTMHWFKSLEFLLQDFISELAVLNKKNKNSYEPIGFLEHIGLRLCIFSHRLKIISVR